jgi:phage terminase large subunit-like protein
MSHDYSLEGFVAFAKQLVIEDGSHFELELFQRLMLESHFEGAIELVIVIPKKNGKTTLLAALALYHIENWPEAECVIGAHSRDQARILFKQAAGLVRRSGMDKRFDVKPGAGTGEIRKAEMRDGPRLRVMAADAGTGDGVIPTLALVDELHRHPSGDLYGVFRDGLGPRNGRMITISTAGFNLESPLGLLRADAHQMPSFKRDKDRMYNHAVSSDGSFVLHEWCLDQGDDPDDLDAVVLANPASWQTKEALARRHDSPSMTPWQWRRFACGIWTEGEEPWITPQAWDRLADEALEIAPFEPCFLGVDLGVKKDTTAIALVAPREDGTVACEARIFRPPGGEGALPLERVEQEIRDICEGYMVKEIHFDPWSFRRSAELLGSEGLPVVEFPQSPERMANASANLYRLIDSGVLRHSGDPELRAQVLAGVTKETERGWRLAKDPKRRPIDALIALAMAAFGAGEITSEPFAMSF